MIKIEDLKLQTFIKVCGLDNIYVLDGVELTECGCYLKLRRFDQPDTWREESPEDCEVIR